MKRILVPTDFSDHAEYALKVAAQIAKKNNGEIFLLHMLELPSQMSDAMTGGSDIPEVMFFMQKAHEKFESIKNQDFLSDIPVTEAVQFERAFEGIMKSSKKHEIDLIVMGSHGASGFEEVFIGSNTEKVVRTSDVPVLVVKKDYTDFTIENFVFASDFSNEIKKPFQKAIDFAAIFNAHLHLVMINTPNDFKSTDESEKIMTDFVKNFKLDNYSLHVYNDVNVEKGILNFASHTKADIIGMSTHGRKGLNHFFNGSISEDLVNHAVRPVITFKI
ncbi:universal stress protein [Flavobacterium sp. '19STA2R22 D10 B1']|uniref:universal stress protein n=1 Tax=Flavobacterium aerium TaxID=3037261 RepID=UPI00278C8592|nr:universal stress protein [Flavobacterium sp. '19STA2R22 D10 B1']